MCTSDQGGNLVCSNEKTGTVRDTLLAYAAMVERCENLLKDYDLYGSVSEANKQKCDLLRNHINYILKGATDERK